jgi:hypothetical protein
MAKPTTHEDLLDIYKTRADEHGCGFLLAGELDEAANVLINGSPALDLDNDTFKLRLPANAWGYIELELAVCRLERFGCSVTYYKVSDLTVSIGAIEAAFIELLDGALPSGGVG